eukprot:CAMPEP_0197525544 /NCGR_PEP_ID=MMETSP1318-20131121/12862_1 /TAXON_ID=552666 /ORGANISM="Partenskyella glossopodia, Strain RCC365" /LENGTH=264 /DNA_ID=CAMNT_0043079057 /DNA_START=89 /DNA_END=883 /DNA_ORIENTATION=+
MMDVSMSSDSGPSPLESSGDEELYIDDERELGSADFMKLLESAKSGLSDAQKLNESINSVKDEIVEAESQSKGWNFPFAGEVEYLRKEMKRLVAAVQNNKKVRQVWKEVMKHSKAFAEHSSELAVRLCQWLDSILFPGCAIENAADDADGSFSTPKKSRFSSTSPRNSRTPSRPPRKTSVKLRTSSQKIGVSSKHAASVGIEDSPLFISMSVNIASILLTLALARRIIDYSNDTPVKHADSLEFYAASRIGVVAGRAEQHAIVF